MATALKAARAGRAVGLGNAEPGRVRQATRETLDVAPAVQGTSARHSLYLTFYIEHRWTLHGEQDEPQGARRLCVTTS
jgi:hypothetical protein